MPKAFHKYGNTAAPCRKLSASTERHQTRAEGLPQVRKGIGFVPKAFCKYGKGGGLGRRVRFGGMNVEWISLMRSTKRMKLSFSEYLMHYSVVPFFSFAMALAITPLSNNYFLSGLFGSFVGIVLFYFQRESLRFKEIEIEQTAEDFKEAVRRTSEELEWHVQDCNGNFARIIGAPVLASKTLITIIRNGHVILFNSISNPQYSSTFAFGKNQENYRVFLQNLREVTQGIAKKSVKEPSIKEEWSLIQILIRVVMYPLCLSLIAIGGWSTFQSLNGFFLGLATIAICSVYLYSDFKILRGLKPNQDSV
jgi:hypothetical protein